MADRPLPRQIASRAHVEYLVRPMHNPGEIRRILAPHRAYAAYALGQLQPWLFERSEWWLSRGAQGEALLLHSRGGLGNALFALGTVDALEAALRVHPGPRYTFLTCQAHHMPAVLRHYRMPDHQTVVRMMADRETFHDVGGDVRRLTGRDARELNRLYRADGTPAFYTAQNVDDAVYYGAVEEGRIVAVAGTHVASEADGIAVAGNVFVHPKYRGRGLATRVTSAVTRHVLQSCRDVVLSVDPANVAAVRAYQRLGYREVDRLIEAAATKRGLGADIWLRRALAMLRGRRYQAELVQI